MPEEQNLVLWTPDPNPEPPRSWDVAAWFAGFALVAWLGLRLTPWPQGFEVTAKVEHLEEHGARYDGIFIGSSNVFRSFVPEVIDAELARAGLELETFNLGGPSMFSFETDYVLRRALELESLSRLDYVFVEPGDWDAEPKSEHELRNMLSNRSVFFHDWRQTRNILASVLESDHDLGHKWELGRANVQAFLWKSVSYGQGLRILGRLRGSPRAVGMAEAEIAARRGYQGIEDGAKEDVIRKRRNLLVDDPEGYAEKVETVRCENGAPLPADGFCRRMLEQQAAFVRGAGPEPVYVAAPSGAAQPQALRLAEEGVLPVVAIVDPDAYPDFFAFENRFDPNHLSKPAAVRFSRVFARELAALLLARRGD